MEEAQRRRIRDFVALIIPTVWLCGIVVFEISSGASPSVVSGTVGFAISFATAAYKVRPRPMDRRVLRPIVMGSLLLAVAPLALRAIAILDGDPYLAIGTALGIVAVTILVVYSQVLKVVGVKPAAGHVGGWPIVGGVPHEAKDLGGPIQVVLGHALVGSLLAWLAVAFSSDAALILAAETLIVVMLVITLGYVRISRKDLAGHTDRRVEAGRTQLLLISWGLFGYLAFLLSVGTALQPSTLAVNTLAFFAVFFVFAAAFLRWRRQTHSAST